MPHYILLRRRHPALLLGLCVALAVFVAQISGVQAGNTYNMMLPIVMNNAKVATQPSTAQSMVDQINYYRGLAGVPIVQPHPALTAAAQNHANYDLLNYNDGTAWTNGPHSEVEGKPGFTGNTAADRMAAALFPYAPNVEIMNYFDNPIQSVDGWMATVFHRVGMLNPTSQYVGYGHGRNTAEYVDVVDFGRGATELSGSPNPVVYPANRQTDVPLFGAGETPSPLPAGAQYPIGFPITIQPIFGTTLVVTQAELRDESGTVVTVYPTPAGCDSSCYALIPTAGLQPATVYHAYVAGSVDGVAFTTTWSFTTVACASPGYC